MRTTLVIFLFLVTHLHAGSITGSNSAAASISTTTQSPLDSSISSAPTMTSSVPFDEDAELATIAESCISVRNYAQIASLGNIVQPYFARLISIFVLEQSVSTIGLTELRAALNFAPLPPWKHFNDTDPSEDDLAAAPTIQAYYDLKEPSTPTRSLDSPFLYEHNLPPSIAYLDRRFPSIRTIFRRKFEEIRHHDRGVVDRKTIDRMIGEFEKIEKRLYAAIWRLNMIQSVKCWNAVD